MDNGNDPPNCTIAKFGNFCKKEKKSYHQIVALGSWGYQFFTLQTYNDMNVPPKKWTSDPFLLEIFGPPEIF